MKLLLGIVVAAAATTKTVADSLACSDGTSCNPTKDLIFGFGHDITSFKSASPADCCAACNKEPRCQAWTLDDASKASGAGMCWLHSDVNQQARPGAVSALRNTPLPPPTKDGWYPCANADAAKYKFCDTSLDIEERLADLIPRVATADAGPQLTARESPSLPNISLPSYYWVGSTRTTHALLPIGWLPLTD